MLTKTLQPSRDQRVRKREVHFLLADGQRITVYAIAGSKSRVVLGIDAPQTVKICSAELDLPR